MDAARALGIPCVTPEHILIACVEHPSTRLRDLLARKGMDGATIRDTILARAHRGSEAVSPGGLPVTPSVKRVLEASLAEAQLLREPRIDVAHVFLGLLGDEGIAGEVLRAAGMSIEEARMDLARTRVQDEGPDDGATHE